ncbi:MAG: hypothetical protein COT74_01675 [Bdellovibrionales bacterium CG10_big_fil_rev_8_21_14_0_10_45_34]|nr:MAG: hypothetical protein COT74_01675 [Bdellovibrionales bacterium CG10_big_fil_rev_8_21_14_0_10_45_34]
MAKIVQYLKAKVVECVPATDEKDLSKNLKWVVILESERKVTNTLSAPDFIRCKSLQNIPVGEHLLEVEQFHIADGRTVKSYTRILKKVEAK